VEENTVKIFIVVDMEGATGVVHREQLMPEGRGYSAGQKLLTGDVNAVIDGVLSVDPDAEFVIGDGHGPMRNVLLEELHPQAELVIGPAQVQNKPLVQVEGIDDSFDLAVLVGFHSKAGTPSGVLSHTFIGSTICSLTMNGRVVGEAEADAAIMACFNVPVGLVIGNSDLEPEIREWNNDCLFVSTKRSLGPTAAICKPPSRTRPEISAAAAAMVTRHMQKPFDALGRGRTTFEVETYRREMTDRALNEAGTMRIDERRFAVEAGDAAEAFRMLWRALARTQEEPASWMA
jgi:D-amino peptidase